MTSLGDSWDHYVGQAGEFLSQLGPHAHRVVAELSALRRRGNVLYLAGNGGSATAASHFAQDLLKTASEDGLPFRAIALTDNMAVITAYANDHGFDTVFAEPLRLLAKPGDRFLAISCSGSSPNVVHAARCARDIGVRVIAVTACDGGDLRELADVEVNVATFDVGLGEALHSILFHYVTRMLRSSYKELCKL